ncbi:oxidoreductase [Solimonas variicoloris]|uniref:oxidoreductase n=1 Tax=Solimonas variicoloris TaxID=254408 RepID=UPI00037FCC3C|nr:oxidoreductase [Solimonas variicoloris]
MAGWSTADIPPLPGRRALVTGGAAGLGFEVARALAAAGAEVLIADRNVAGGEAAARQLATGGGRARFAALDLGDLASVRSFAADLVAEAQPLDILVNNAGLLPRLDRATTRDGFELKFGVSHLGHYALTGLLLPALLRSRQARVVSVSSIVHRHAAIDFDDLQAERHYEGQRAYGQTKLACLMYALALQRRALAAGWPLASLAAHPGVARTAIGEARMTEPSRRWRDRVEVLLYRAVMRWGGQSAADGALPLLYAATDPHASGGGFYGPRGLGELRGAPVRVQPARHAQDPAAQDRLWTVSEALTGVRYPP